MHHLVIEANPTKFMVQSNYTPSDTKSITPKIYAKLDNLSVEFIRGFYFISSQFFNEDLKVTSDITLNEEFLNDLAEYTEDKLNTLRSDGIARSLHHKDAIKEYNTRFKQLIRDEHNITTEVFVVHMIGIKNSQIVVFNDIDFINGMETCRSWALHRTNLGMWNVHYRGQLCHTNIICNIPAPKYSQRDAFMNMFNSILINDLLDIILQYCANRCLNYDRGNPTPFNTFHCETLCDEMFCNVCKIRMNRSGNEKSNNDGEGDSEDDSEDEAIIFQTYELYPYTVSVRLDLAVDF